MTILKVIFLIVLLMCSGCINIAGHIAQKQYEQRTAQIYNVVKSVEADSLKKYTQLEVAMIDSQFVWTGGFDSQEDYINRVMVESIVRIIELGRFDRLSIPNNILTNEADERNYSNNDIDLIRKKAIPKEKLGENAVVFKIVFDTCCDTGRRKGLAKRKVLKAIVNFVACDRNTNEELISATIFTHEDGELTIPVAKAIQEFVKENF